MNSFRRWIGIGILAATVAVVDDGASAENPGSSDPPTSVNETTHIDLECIPVAAYWQGSEPAAGTPPGPDLAVVTFDIRPKDARVHLDERFIGRSRFFNGKKGHLFLESGSYLIELRLEGYRVVRIEFAAEAQCRYDVIHRLERFKGGANNDSEASYGKGRPLNRVFAPLSSPEIEVASGAGKHKPAAPDVRLRSDLGQGSKPSTDRHSSHASLRLRVSPEQASIFIDGVFVATAGELTSMEGPLATTAGERLVEITADGFQKWSETAHLSAGEVKEMSVKLTPQGPVDE